jgi:hypothetical protein
MPRLSLWNPDKKNDFRFVDRIVGEHLYAGGTGVNIHKLIGIQDINDTGDATQPSSVGSDETFIQDVLFLENRDRKYDDDIYEMRGQYNLPDSDGFDFTQFGLFLSNDTLFMNFHIESMVDTIGRKLMPGDVIELPHLRDDLLLGSDEAINRFYVVTDGNRPSEGFDPMWWPHLWKVKLGPITDSQEFRDILGDGTEEGDLRDLISRYDDIIDINDKIIEQAEADVPYDPMYMDNAHLYFDATVPDKPGIAVDRGGADGQPPNGVALLGSGATFPDGAADGAYFLRTDFTPNRLFEKSGSRWLNIGTDTRGAWAAANKVLTTYINNDSITTGTDGLETPEKTNLSKIIKPKTDN